MMTVGFHKVMADNGEVLSPCVHGLSVGDRKAMKCLEVICECLNMP
jgi:hypothetical protein